ncbi:S8 family serine peptidase [Nocardioides jiangxiensis]|uniref:S8 family serine peptidase n=1 Tax=Nocardioides jiangxiensis TaxID=3064524 RepID=A0ABT9AZC0_9ACTN|nr:S8 family serine peptidase [Nocardioides sp. WY-20]MDO7867942.1 S8 family serine peptidase [Nocardioides sp. WY-20]
MSPQYRIPVAVLASTAAALAITLAPAGASTQQADPPGSTGGDSTAVASPDRSRAIVQLAGDPLSTSVRTRPSGGHRIDFGSSAVRNERAQLASQRAAFKQWLRAHAPAVRVTGEYDIALNAVAVRLNGTPVSTLAGAPGVRAVQLQGTYRPTDDHDPDLSIISAQSAWQASQVGGSAGAGRGVKVAIVDTGIDVSHPCFDDAGFPATRQLGDTHFTNNKVIVARVFNNKAKVMGYTPAAMQEHGTHVAGTVACDLDTPADVNGVTIPYGVSGVAPAAQLGNYNIFPAAVDDARSEDILDALEQAYTDGMDVANMSLGGSASGIDDLLTVAIDDLDRANMVVAVAAGNSGPGHYTVESPGSAQRALTAGASTVPHFVGSPFSFGGGSTGLAAGDFATVSTDLTAPIGVVTGSIGGLGDACSALPAGSLAGKIAVLSRGGCAFSVKIRTAQAAGAAAAVVVNNVAGDPVSMGQDGTADQPTIPAYMASLADRAALAAADGASGTIGATTSYISSTNVDIMAGFSSQGPTDADFRVKPDVVAPGVNVLSSIPASFCDTPPCWAFFQGTSMATPHLAGSAAVVIGAHPSWSAAAVRSAIVNTADQGVLKDSATGTSVVDDVNVVGAGREDLLSAVGATVALGPVSTSFGSTAAGSGTTLTRTVTVTNLGGSAATYSLAVDSTTGSGVTFSGSPASVSLAPGASATVTVRMVAARGAAKGDHQAMLRLSAGGTEVAHSALYAFIK